MELLASNNSGGGTVTNLNEMNALPSQNRAMEEEIKQQTLALQMSLDENTNMAEKAIMAQLYRERIKMKMEQLFV